MQPDIEVLESTSISVKTGISGRPPRRCWCTV